MNALTNLSTAPTMSSREIAELTGKEHKNVLVDIRKVLTELKSQPSDFAGDYIDSTGRRLPAYLLPKRETLILVSGYSVALRAKIIDRWQELEDSAAHPIVAVPNFSNPAEAARAWADQFEQREGLSLNSQGNVDAPRIGDSYAAFAPDPHLE